MAFVEIVDQAIALLRDRVRISYRVLRREFALDDEQLEDLKAELIDAQRVARDEDGKVLVWVGEVGERRAKSVERGKAETDESSTALRPTLHAPRAEAERRQLTVMFCDLVGSTALSARLDPEELREVVQAYQQTCTEIITRHEGYIAQYLGDGILVYFGYPTAHEDDARRAVRSGLEIVKAIREQVTGNGGQARRLPLQVRIGIHTGLVVIGDIGAGERTEQLALGETPNVAARIQGLAEPNTVLVSATTQRLVDAQFECQPFGSHLVKGIDTPIAVYNVQNERQSGGQLEGKAVLTPLVGREQEMGLLVDRWEQVKEGRGQVVLLSGEPGIGKSRLAYTLREHVASEGSLLYEARCSPYHQHSALYPLIEVLQRTLLLTRQDTDDEKVQKLERTLALYNMQETLPFFTALLSLPTPAQYPSLNLTPQKQKERTLQALVQLLVAQAERQATVWVWEDLHWADPSSLEFLSLLIEQIPTSKLLLVLTFRPEFTPSWKPRSHLSQLVLNRLSKKQVEAMIEKVGGGKALSAEVIEQVRLKTDGVPLFVEELIKSVIESVESIESPHHTPRQLVIPATLQDTLMARLDRLSSARQVAQLGATLGREFPYELLHAVAPINETDLQTALSKLVEAEILYQRGVGQQTRYFFKHALIQDTAYQSLLKSTRQRYHQQIARALVEHSPETVETQPELLAHHYTEAGLTEQAIPYWQRAGQNAVQHSANVEAVSHLTKGLDLLKTLPDTPERAQQELTLQLAQGGPLMATKGPAAPEVEQAYARALELCRQVGDTPQLFPALAGLRVFYTTRGELQTARELGEQLLRLAQSVQDPALLAEAHVALGASLILLGELASAREHFEQGIVLYDPRQQRASVVSYGVELGLTPAVLAHVLWMLGYSNQAREHSREALTRAQEVNLPFSTAVVWAFNIELHQFLHDAQAVQQRAEALSVLCHEQGVSGSFAGMAIIPRGWALAMQGQEEEGIQQIQQGLTAVRATRMESRRPYGLALLAEAYGKTGQVEEGLTALVEALALVDKTMERFYEAELYRLRGELTLAQSKASLGQALDKSRTSLEGVSNESQTSQDKSENTDPRPLTPDPQGEAEACFLKAIEIARKQQAKSLELRASTSLARLWQSQGKEAEAHKLLSEVYNWFVEGFDTKDLQEAKTLLDSLESQTVFQ
jgi:class 3 adenylate cyclase/predicted ATPase